MVAVITTDLRELAGLSETFLPVGGAAINTPSRQGELDKLPEGPPLCL